MFPDSVRRVPYRQQKPAPRHEPPRWKKVPQEYLTDLIRVAAYFAWQRAGEPIGRDLDYWLIGQHEIFKSLRQ